MKRRRVVERTCWFEPLEHRHLLSGWHNSLIPVDVDASGLVTPLDVLLIVSDLNAQGSRSLPPTQPESGSKRYIDVNNDSKVTPLDALHVINALNQNQGPLSLAFSIAPASDPNGNGVVLANHVTLLGQTALQARVQLRIDGLGSDLSVVLDRSRSAELLADQAGNFQIAQELFHGLNQITVAVTDRLGRALTIQREIIRSDVVADWNAALLNVVRDWTTTSNDPYPGRIVPSSPPVVARNLAMVHVAMFDAINGVSNEYASYLNGDSAPPDTSAVAAAASAAYEVALVIDPSAKERAVWQATLAESLRTVADGPAKERGIVYGRMIAARILAERSDDGSNASANYSSGTAPGQWHQTGTDLFPPLLPHWGDVRPMAVVDIGDFLAEPPPALTTVEYAHAVDEVMRLGRVDSPQRTEEQTQIAQFWSDGGGTATPPGHWNRIAAQVSLDKGESLLERAHSMALLNLALFDAGIASWDAKYHYDFWRPIDAIRRASEDGNEATEADITWLPLLRTPPFPAYTSGHSNFSAAAAAVLSALYGDKVAFASRSDGHSGLTQKPLSSVFTRQFSSFLSAAEEAGMSRIYGGIHFQFDNVSGARAGEAIGEYVVANWLLAVS